jgi:type II secretory pathway component PulK
MLTVLWVITVGTVVALTGALMGRNAVNAARNRIQMERAFWAASGCAHRVQARIDERLQSSSRIDDASLRWRTLDREIHGSPLVTDGGCDYSLEAAGSRLDINGSSNEMLARLLVSLGYGDHAPEMIDALADWSDTDDIRRPLGAEREWYLAASRIPPRNGTLADISEVPRVRGFEDVKGLDSVLSTEHGRVSLATAPATVLTSVPGFTRETAERIVELRDTGTPLSDLIQLPGMVSKASRDELLAHFAEIVRITTVDPDAWILTVRAQNGLPPSSVVVEWRMVRAGRRVAAARMRMRE